MSVKCLMYTFALNVKGLLHGPSLMMECNPRKMTLNLSDFMFMFLNFNYLLCPAVGNCAAIWGWGTAALPQE